MALFRPQTLLDKTYEIGILLKGIDGVIELTGGILVLVLSKGTILRITNFFTQDTLQENPHNFLANHILHAGQHLASGQTTFAAAFLLTHGAVKVGLVSALLMNKLWAYPWALVVLGLFLVYQMFLLITHTTFGMAFLSVLDAIIIYLVWREWQKVRLESQPA